VREADVALYEAKAAGRAAFKVFDASMNARTAERLELETHLRQALERRELRVHYQPEVDIRGGVIVGMEALVRWQHPRRGLIAPDEFIPVAEETGIILDIGPWVLAEACRQAASWRERFPGEPRRIVSVNVSAREFSRPELVADVAALLDTTGLDPACLRLEITESAVMRDAELASRTLHALRDLRVMLAIDDFGTGYSSLSYLRQFPVDTVKIDRSFVAALGTDESAVSIVRAVIALGHALGMDVTAEGIETAEQLACLKELDCDRAQGYFFWQPVPANVMGEILRRNWGTAGTWLPGLGWHRPAQRQAG
jgi:EAL domain-containing protein (putative c-di-GMP-specific phosphodiesterase class I)